MVTTVVRQLVQIEERVRLRPAVIFAQLGRTSGWLCTRFCLFEDPRPTPLTRRARAAARKGFTAGC
ncbi:MAG: hypothetical protein ACLU0O_08810 [Collinsella sp.]